MGFKHLGLFPEQAANWDRIMSMIKTARDANPGRQVKVLNLFAYTGGATLAAAAAGASVCHVDAAKGMVSLARENASSSGLGEAPIRYIVDDCMKFIEREQRRGNTYDGIIMDPPSYGRGPNGEVWKLEDGASALVESAAKLLSPDALFFIVNSYSAGLAPSAMGYMLSLAIQGSRGGSVSSDEIGIKVSQTGAVLPCGAVSIWTRE
jgi:23S rRNA (cytosine1962-C5)-methyltransferase